MMAYSVLKPTVRDFAAGPLTGIIGPRHLTWTPGTRSRLTCSDLTSLSYTFPRTLDWPRSAPPEFTWSHLNSVSTRLISCNTNEADITVCLVKTCVQNMYITKITTDFILKPEQGRAVPLLLLAYGPFTIITIYQYWISRKE